MHWPGTGSMRSYTSLLTTTTLKSSILQVIVEESSSRLDIYVALLLIPLQGELIQGYDSVITVMHMVFYYTWIAPKKLELRLWTGYF